MRIARFRHPGRFGAAFLPLRLALILAIGFAAGAAQAARPMITDDASIVDAKACQLESWVQHNRVSTEYWALPACNFSGNLELAAGGAHFSADGGAGTHIVQIQGKTLFKPLAANGWGIGLVGGVIHRIQTADDVQDWFAYVPASFSFRNDRALVHTNLGWLREGETRRNHLTWNLGAEAQLAPRIGLVAEIFGQAHGEIFYQIGLVHWLMLDHVQLDVAYGNRMGSRAEEQWFSFGLTLVSVPFLP